MRTAAHKAMRLSSPNECEDWFPLRFRGPLPRDPWHCPWLDTNVIAAIRSIHHAVDDRDGLDRPHIVQPDDCVRDGGIQSSAGDHARVRPNAWITLSAIIKALMLRTSFSAT